MNGGSIADWLMKNGDIWSSNTITNVLPAGWSVVGTGDYLRHPAPEWPPAKRLEPQERCLPLFKHADHKLASWMARTECLRLVRASCHREARTRDPADGDVIAALVISNRPGRRERPTRASRRTRSSGAVNSCDVGSRCGRTPERSGPKTWEVLAPIEIVRASDMQCIPSRWQVGGERV
jgi:hypothetical protein